MTAFTPDQYRFVVERLAEGDMPVDVAAQVNVDWPGSSFTARDTAALLRGNLNADWQAYFDACRAAFKVGAPTSDVAFRIALLDKMARTAVGRGASELARSLIELIEKIQSGYFGGKNTSTGTPADDPLAKGGTLLIERTIVDPNAEGR